MLVVRSPLRVSLGGGGTDLPSYYRDRGGFCISAAIDKYVYVAINRPFVSGIFLKYSKYEEVKNVNSVSHPIIREALTLLNLGNPQIEITTMADIPAGTGLGSSGSFTTAIIKALFLYQKLQLRSEELANLACEIEIDRLGEPVGKQDQYIAAIGGVTAFDFHKDDTVSGHSLKIAPDSMLELEDNLLLFFTGYSRSASTLLVDQNLRSQEGDANMLNHLDYVKDLGYRSLDALISGNMNLFGELLHEHWEHKKLRSNAMSNPMIDEFYELGLKNGAIGGKLVGAGGGGFLMFMAHDRQKLRNVMRHAGLNEVRFKFDFEGTKLVLSS